MSFLSAIVGGIFSGIGSRSEGRRQERQTREERRENYNNQLRMTEYEARLADALRQRQRSEIARGWDNWNNPAGKPNREPVALPSLADYLNKG